MNDHLVGIPDPEVLARDLYLNGHFSCADAEAAGWFVTAHLETRERVDTLLGEKLDRALEALKTLNKSARPHA